MVSPSSRSTLFPYTTLFRSRSFARIGLQIHGMAEGVMHEHLLQTAHDPPQHRHFVLFDPLLRPQRLGVAVHEIGRASCRERVLISGVARSLTKKRAELVCEL